MALFQKNQLNDPSVKSDSTGFLSESAEKNNALKLQDNRPKSIAQRKKSETGSGKNTELPVQKKNATGLPDNLKSGIENLSGHSMDDVKVHYNSDKPAQLNAHAYAQGTDIHVASGQEKHLAHEAWHVVQQKQGRVKPTMQMKGKVNINDDKGLESEADVMGAKALSSNLAPMDYVGSSSGMMHSFPVQRTEIRIFQKQYDTEDKSKNGAIMNGLEELHRAGFLRDLYAIRTKLRHSESEVDAPYIAKVNNILKYGGLSRFVQDINQVRRIHKEKSGQGTNVSKAQLNINGHPIYETEVAVPGSEGKYSYGSGGHDKDVENSRADSEVKMCGDIYSQVASYMKVPPDKVEDITVNVVSWWGPCNACKHRYAKLKADLEAISKANVKIQVFYLHKDLNVTRGHGSWEKRTKYGQEDDKKVEHTGLYGHLY